MSEQTQETKKKTSASKTKTSKKSEKFTLVELVKKSEAHYPSIIMDLAEAGLLEQYYQELEDYGRLDIEPTITIDEFKKIIGE